MLEDLVVKDEADAFVLTTAPVPSCSRLSLFAAAGVPELAKSNDVPGVLGVFVVDPKDAKAPEPSPKAEEAPVVGEEIFVVVKGDIPFIVFTLPPALPSPANRFAVE